MYAQKTVCKDEFATIVKLLSQMFECYCQTAFFKCFEVFYQHILCSILLIKRYLPHLRVFQIEFQTFFNLNRVIFKCYFWYLNIQNRNTLVSKQ